MPTTAPTTPTHSASALWDDTQAAAYLSIAKNTLVAWRCTRRVDGPAFLRLGRAVRYRQQDLDAFIERCTVSGDAA